MLAGNRDFVRKYPVATKRVTARRPQGRRPLRANPDRVARRLVDGRFTTRYDYAVQALREIPYDGGENTMPRTLCDSTRCGCTSRIDQVHPQKIIADGTDWRFLNESSAS